VTVRKQVELGFESWGRLVFRRRWWVFFASILFAIGWMPWISKLHFDNSTQSFLLQKDPASILYQKFQRQFGQDDQIMVAIAPPQIFHLGFLERLRAFHHSLERDLPHLAEVTSLLNARQTRGEEEALIVEDLLEDWPETEAQLRDLKRRVLANPVYLNVLISEDARLTTVMLKPVTYSSRGMQDDLLAGFEDSEDDSGSQTEFLSATEKAEIVAALNDVVSRFEAPDFPIHVVGEIVTSERLNLAMRRDLNAYIGATGFAIAALLLLLFRRVSGVVLPFIMVAAALPTTVGVIAFFGIPGSIALLMLPVFVITVGVCNAIHVLVVTYQRLNAGVDVEDAIAFAFGHSGLAIVMTNLTTAAGMSSFLTATITPIQQLGIAASIGVIVVLFYTLGLLPALLSILPLKRGLVRDQNRLQRLLLWTGDLATRRPRWVLIGTALLTLLMIVGISQVRFSHKPLNWFPSQDPVRVAVERVDRELRGTNTVEVWVDSGRENGLHDPDVLRRIEILMARAQALEHDEIFVGKAISIVDILKETNQALNENQPDHYTVPGERGLIAQELLLFENSGSDDLEEITDSQFRNARITLRVPVLDGVAYPPFLSRLGVEFQEILGDDLPFVLTGITPLMAKANSALGTSLLRSYAYALLVITPLMILLIGRFRVGLLSMVPNLLPVITTLGVMGLCGVPLDAGNIILGSVIIGLAVNDTIHFMHRFQRDFAECGEVREAVRRALATTGSALLFTSLVLTSGFLVMAGFGSMRITIVFGLFASLGIMVAFLADVVISPALLALVFQRSDRAAEPERPTLSLPNARCGDRAMLR
jgi:predicted RND superfamily exporter protein